MAVSWKSRRLTLLGEPSPTLPMRRWVGVLSVASTTPRLAPASKAQSQVGWHGVGMLEVTLIPWPTSDLTSPIKRSSCASEWHQTTVWLGLAGTLTLSRLPIPLMFAAVGHLPVPQRRQRLPPQGRLHQLRRQRRQFRHHLHHLVYQTGRPVLPCQ